ncbi:cytoskeleton protein RodZ [Ferrimonas balearica]|uniref:cytoskeleton protein RodZ n=1 Tax=Ferrimonas balearica TaxID=44012 RepID=UPI001F383C59|nr:cytoskeleton protein RodZ [Ferrimonas balearica]MBY6017446.1 cytoskeleton protein RodZ [Halomonas denitrificans]MBY6093711.1 cytoskeleton protein RodZ [Ferrimonas balearica]
MSDELNHETPVETPGPLLKAARERAGLTTQQVAQRLNLRHSVVQGMEQDSFEPGTSVTYIRGYVRNYARLVGLDESRLNQALDTLHRVEPTPNMQSFSRRTNREKADNRWMMATWVIALGIVGLVVWWWLANADSRQLAPQGNDTQVEAPVAGEVPEQLEPQTLPEVAPEAAEQVSEAAYSGSESAGEIEMGAVTTADQPADEPVTEPVAEQPKTESAPVNAPSAAQAAQAEPENAPAEPADAASSRLAIALKAECWMLVQDADGEVLLEGLKLDGFKTELTGKAPFSLRLGAPEAVSLEFNGDAVDLSSFRAGRVARLTLPQ